MTAKDTTLRTLADLIGAGLADPADASALEAVAARYAVAVTPAIVARIAGTGRDGPIAAQYLPSAHELHPSPEERTDPIGDETHSPVRGIVHRYADRVLLKVTHLCPVYCRFCFRRETVGMAGEAMLAPEQLKAALAYIAADPAIWEVILTGGDPFILSPRRINALTGALGAIPHVKILRWHTRVPVADPARVTDDFIRALRVTSKTTYVAIHVNHAEELAGDALVAIARLADAGIPLLSQTVLLKGINDDAAALEALMRRLTELRIKPYYLHHADLAPGTAHFRTSLAAGQELVRELRKRASGLCQPLYVLDIPGGAGKVPAGPAYVALGEPTCRVRDEDGEWHDYWGG